MEALSHVCPTNRKVFNQVMHKTLVAEILNEVLLQISDALEKWKMKGFSGCEKMFIRSLTNTGYYYTFNIVGYQSLFNEDISSDFDCNKRKKIPKTWNNDAELYDDDDDDDIKRSKWTIEEGYLNNADYIFPFRATG
ncbi:hypothetical protein ACKWTF_011560 [Chironomus riparius]